MPLPAEMERMVAQAGLTLNAGQMADLALAWRQIVGLMARIPRDRKLLDDQAYVFKVPPPGSVPAPATRKVAVTKTNISKTRAPKPAKAASPGTKSGRATPATRAGKPKASATPAAPAKPAAKNRAGRGK